MNSKTRMIDVASKDDTKRAAIACGEIRMNPETIQLLKNKALPKGDPLEISRAAGILAAKQTPFLIPLCHPLFLTGVTLEFELLSDHVKIIAAVSSVGKTGVEMEALTAVSIAALSIYDVCKAVDKEMVIGDIYLLEKTGGKSGHFKRQT